ncbi:hypothetical protein [Bradyrhizobium cytisi]|uniref:Uncharacterized protein n=1 Tax=Bradyrhizobium cytisi TaxID=515489 RepID=A0A5S4VT39_9BRAD|nr:hypothetical protein [Bradyrhizobium cytisi]TYL70151.1 hypothetical protein FXB38_42035 [Bradyrhizobium cytisi]
MAELRLGEGENAPGSELNLRVVWSIFRKSLPLYPPAERKELPPRVLMPPAEACARQDRAIANMATKDVEATDAEPERAGIERRIRKFLCDYFEELGIGSQVGAESARFRKSSHG